jgi:hypothetical protein
MCKAKQSNVSYFRGDTAISKEGIYLIVPSNEDKAFFIPLPGFVM